MVQRPVRHQPHGGPAGVERLHAVHRAEHVCVQRGAGIRRERGYEDLVHDRAAGRADLVAAAHHAGLPRRGLEAPPVPVHREPERGQVELHGLQAALEHQRARHARVVLEMPVEEPVAGGHSGLGPQVAAPQRPSRRIEVGDRVEPQHPARADARCSHVRTGCGPLRAEAVGRASLGEGTHLAGTEAAPGARDGRRGQRPVLRRHLRGLPGQALGAGELVAGEEPRLPFADRHPQFVAGVAVVMEEEDPDAVVLGVPVDLDLIPERLAGQRRAAMEGDLAAEQPVHPVALTEQVDPEPADEQQVRLPRLDHQPGRHPACRVQVPAVRCDVGLGPYRAGAHGARDRIDAGDPVDQQHGGLRQAGLLRPVVQHGKLRAEQLGDPALRQPFELGAVERRTARDHTAL